MMFIFSDANQLARMRRGPMTLQKDPLLERFESKATAGCKNIAECLEARHVWKTNQIVQTPWL
jgi:hypothetical protein